MRSRETSEQCIRICHWAAGKVANAESCAAKFASQSSGPELQQKIPLCKTTKWHAWFFRLRLFGVQTSARKTVPKMIVLDQGSWGEKNSNILLFWFVGNTAKRAKIVVVGREGWRSFDASGSKGSLWSMRIKWEIGNCSYSSRSRPWWCLSCFDVDDLSCLINVQYRRCFIGSSCVLRIRKV